MASVNNDSASKVAYSYLQYKNKIGGLVSGMDIDSLMEKLMKAESAQMEKLQQQKQKYEWQRDAYREVNTTLSSFEKGIFDDYGKQSSWNAKTVSNSASDKINVTATANAAGNLNITSATLATAATVTNTYAQDINYTATQKLSELGVTTTSGEFKFTTSSGDETIEYSKDDTVDSFITKLNGAGIDARVENGKLIVSTDMKVNDTDSKNFISNLGLDLQTDNSLKMVDGKAASKNLYSMTNSSKISALGLTDGTFKVVGLNSEGTDFVEKEISFKATDTVESVLNKINNSGVGITAVMSGSSISLTSNTAGEGIEGKVMGVTEDSQGVFKKLGFFSKTSSNNDGIFDTGDTGKNGSLTVNGVTINQSSNTYNISGYKLEINQEIPAGSNVKITSTNDVDTVIDKVKAFVETYNGLIKDLNAKVTQKKNVDYSPLTDAQKAEMTTDEITKWEEKAKAGLLKGDSNINAALSSMRQTLSAYNTYTMVDKVDENGNPVLDSSGKQVKEKKYTPNNSDVLFKIGITTSTSYSDNGKLEINEDKLRKALEEDPDIVSRIFTGDSATGAEGVVSQLRTAAKNAVSNIEVTSGKATSTSEKSYSIGRTISDLSTKIDDWKDRLKDIEERYWKQFSAMETAIQKANSQSSIFSA